MSDDCDDPISSKVDKTISESAHESLQKWEQYDDSTSRYRTLTAFICSSIKCIIDALVSFCHVDAEVCPDCTYVDLTLNPERYTGYSGEASQRIWRAVYEENCFRPSEATKDDPPDVAFLKDKVGWKWECTEEVRGDDNDIHPQNSFQHLNCGHGPD